MSKKDDVVVVKLSGRIDVEYAEPFRDACLKEIATLGKNILFNMTDLSFVGSNGITPFVKTIVDLSRTQDSKLKFCGVGSEFQKIFAASPLQNVETFESEDLAVRAFAERPDMSEAQVQAAAMPSNFIEDEIIQPSIDPKKIV